MIRFELSVDVARPVQEVFAYVTDPTRLAERQPNVVFRAKRQFSAQYERLEELLESGGAG